MVSAEERRLYMTDQHSGAARFMGQPRLLMLTLPDSGQAYFIIIGSSVWMVTFNVTGRMMSL